jgi:flavin reductase (DIM6/NTAB) family NADH-FMN oxidoreductase RutF
VILDLSTLGQSACYKVLTALVIPRPIGWITSVSERGVVNLAPYSFFNVLGTTPPIVAFGPSQRSDGEPKDTERNIAASKDFVVNLVTPECAPAMHQSAATYGPEQSEALALGLSLLPSKKVKAPRVALSPVHLECRYDRTVRIGDNHVVFGEILLIHAQEGIVDPETFRPGPTELVGVGRLAGPGHYATTRDRMDLGAVPKPKLSD